MDEQPEKTIIFAVTEEQVQDAALGYIGRKLTEDEMSFAIKGIEEGLSFDLETVFETAVLESVEAAAG